MVPWGFDLYKHGINVHVFLCFFVAMVKAFLIAMLPRPHVVIGSNVSMYKDCCEKGFYS